MDVVDQYAELWEGVRNSFESGRLAHAYVIVGAPRGNALRFAEAFLKLLYCEHVEKPCNACTGCRQVAAHKHIDTLWLEPRSKARQITAEEVRGLVHRMAQTSFEGGWKAGILLSAERMNVNSANVLLKTLEEPPQRTLLLLITDSPQSLLPTIVSRCQKIVLSKEGSGSTDELWEVPLLEVMRQLPPRGGLDASRLASRLKSILDAVKDEIVQSVEDELGSRSETLDESKVKETLDARTNARLREVQSSIFQVMLDWQRDILLLVSKVDAVHLAFPDEADVLVAQAARHNQASALQAVQAVEAMARRLDRNIPALQNFDEAFRRLVR